MLYPFGIISKIKSPISKRSLDSVPRAQLRLKSPRQTDQPTTAQQSPHAASALISPILPCIQHYHFPHILLAALLRKCKKSFSIISLQLLAPQFLILPISTPEAIASSLPSKSSKKSPQKPHKNALHYYMSSGGLYRCNYASAFNGYQILLRNLLLHGLFRNRQIENSVPVIGIDICFFNILANVEASRHRSGVALLPE